MWTQRLGIPTPEMERARPRQSRRKSRERERLREWDFPGALNRERGEERRRRRDINTVLSRSRRPSVRPFYASVVRSLKGQVRVKRKTAASAGTGRGRGRGRRLGSRKLEGVPMNWAECCVTRAHETDPAVRQSLRNH